LNRQAYLWIRQNSSEVRKTHGWQTKDGVKRISESRKGTMPVKDSKTGVMIGSVSVIHPKVLSGEWVHHSKGCTISEEMKSRLSIINQGSGNANYNLQATPQKLLEVLNNGKDECIVEGVFSIKRYIKYLNTILFKKVSRVIIKNRFETTKNFVAEYNKKYDEKIIYNPYFRSKEVRQQFRELYKGITMSEETRKKISIGVKRAKNNKKN